MSFDNFVDISVSRIRRPPRSARHNAVITFAPSIPCYTLNGNPITYDNRTMLYYKTSRTCHYDPILNIEVGDNIAFKFKQQWDPYTGDRTGDDPFGALYFHPMSLVYHYYLHRLDGLWKNAVDTQDGYYEGYYDMLVGTGNELEVVGRDKYTELYLFRLPIFDCYLTKEHNKSFITMGPKLNDNEIDELDSLCKIQSVQNDFMTNFGIPCPSIRKIKNLYDAAIAKNVSIPSTYIKQYIVPQHFYVDQLRQM